MPVLLVLVAAVLFGTTGTAKALGLDGVDPFVVGALRIAVGGAVLGAVGLVAVRRRLARPRAVELGLVLLGAIGVAAYQPTFFAGTQTNGIAVGTLVALGSAPVFTGLIAWAVGRRAPSGRWAGATGAAVLGIVLLSGVLDPAAAVAASPVGVVLSLLAGASYAVYTIAAKGLLDRGWATLPTMGAVFGTSAVIGAIELVAVGGVPPLPGGGVAAVLWLGVATVAVAYVLFARGLERLPAPVVSTITLAEPVVAAALGVGLLGERVTPLGLAGVALLVAALTLLVLPARRSRAGRPEPIVVP